MSVVPAALDDVGENRVGLLLEEEGARNWSTNFPLQVSRRPLQRMASMAVGWLMRMAASEKYFDGIGPIKVYGKKRVYVQERLRKRMRYWLLF